MSKTKFTPGPWYADCENVDEFDDIEVFSVGEDEEEREVCAVRVGASDLRDDGTRLLMPDRTLANARLIAAAPQMYEALSRYVAIDDADECGDELARAARAALAAATGESQ